MPHRLARLLPWALLLVLGSACFARLIAEPSGLMVDARRPSIDHTNHRESRPIGNDLTFYHLPRHLQMRRNLEAFGRIPLWDSSGFGGRPMLGNPQAGLLYPPGWLAWLVDSPAVLGWLTVAHLLWGAAGTYLLARSQRMKRWPASLAAGLYQTSPYLLAQTFEGHYPHVWSACWFPWGFWAVSEFRAGRSRGLLALPPILAMACLTGHPQEGLLLVVSLSCWLLADALSAWRRGPEERRAAVVRLLGWSGVLLLALGLIAIEVVPELEVLPWVQKAGRADGSTTVPNRYALHLLNGFQLLAPDALGGPSHYFGIANYWESVFSFGLAGLVLLTVGATASLERSKARGWTALLVVSIWFAAGRKLGLFSLVYSWMPGMHWFRVPARSLFLASLAAAMLAGLGAEALERTRLELAPWRQFAVRLVSLLALVLVGLFLTRTLSMARLHEWRGRAHASHLRIDPDRVDLGRDPDRSSGVLVPRNLWRLRAASRQLLGSAPFWITMIGLSIAAAAGCLSTRTSIRRISARFMGVLALGELAWYGFALIQVAPADRFFRPDEIGQTLMALENARPTREPLRVRARDVFFQDLQAVVSGVEKTNLNDVFQLEHASILYETLYPVASRSIVHSESALSPAERERRRRVRQAVFDRMAVACLVSDRLELDPPWPMLARGTCGAGPYVVQSNPTALPHAYVVPRAEVDTRGPSSVLARLPEHDSRAAVLMVHDPLSHLPGTPRQPFVAATWLSKDPDRPVLEVETQAPGLLVIADTWMPGWSARVDGRPAPIHIGNLSQRVIPIERAGRHLVQLRYNPPGLVLGAGLSFASVLGWLSLAAITATRRRSRPSRSAPLGTPLPRMTRRPRQVAV
jgi:hypothetical protein